MSDKFSARGGTTEDQLQRLRWHLLYCQPAGDILALAAFLDIALIYRTAFSGIAGTAANILKLIAMAVAP